MSKSDSLTEVSAEQFAEIRADLEKLLKIKQKPDESLAVYALRLAKRATDPAVTKDDDWETLGEKTQFWVNGMIDADEKGTPLILPPDSKSGDPGGNKESESKESTAAKASSKKAQAKDAPGKQGAEPPSPPPAIGVKKAAKTKPAKASSKKADTAATVSSTKAPAKSPGASRRGRRPNHSEDAVIKLEVTENPHRKGSRDYEKFKKLHPYNGKTLGKALSAGVEPAYVRYLEKRKIVSFTESLKEQGIGTSVAQPAQLERARAELRRGS